MSTLTSNERPLILRLRSDLAQLVVDYEDVPDATDIDSQALFAQAKATIRAADEWLDSHSHETLCVGETERQAMDIRTEPGNTVEYAFPANGYPFDQQRLKELGLKVGDLKTVDLIDVQESSSTLYLVEHPGVAFNTVNFANAQKANERLEPPWLAVRRRQSNGAREMRANATDGEKLEEALEILAIALPAARPWTTERDEVKLRIYRNLANDRRNEIDELRATIAKWEESV